MTESKSLIKLKAFSYSSIQKVLIKIQASAYVDSFSRQNLTALLKADSFDLEVGALHHFKIGSKVLNKLMVAFTD